MWGRTKTKQRGWWAKSGKWRREATAWQMQKCIELEKWRWHECKQMKKAKTVKITANWTQIPQRQRVKPKVNTAKDTKKTRRLVNETQKANSTWRLRKRKCGKFTQKWKLSLNFAASSHCHTLYKMRTLRYHEWQLLQVRRWRERSSRKLAAQRTVM